MQNNGYDKCVECKKWAYSISTVDPNRNGTG